MMVLKLHIFYILTIIAIFLFVICEGRQRTVYNIYTGKRGSFFNVSGPGARSKYGSLSPQLTKRLGVLETSLTNITLNSALLSSNVNKMRRDVDKIVNAPKPQNLGPLKLKVKTNSFDISQIKNTLLEGNRQVGGRGLDRQMLTILAKVKAVENRLNANERNDNAKLEKRVDDMMALIKNLQRGLRSEKANRLKTEKTYGAVFNKIKGSGMTPAKSIVAFAAHQNTREEIKGFGRVVFKKVILNKGKGYDPETGVFTAPENGYYVFHVTLTASHRSGVHFELVVNGKARLPVFGIDNPPDNAPVISATNSAVMFLQKEDGVYVLAKKPAVVTDKSTFSGYLIYPSNS